MDTQGTLTCPQCTHCTCPPCLFTWWDTQRRFGDDPNCPQCRFPSYGLAPGGTYLGTFKACSVCNNSQINLDGTISVSFPCRCLFLHTPRSFSFDDPDDNWDLVPTEDLILTPQELGTQLLDWPTEVEDPGAETTTNTITEEEDWDAEIAASQQNPSPSW